MPQLGCVSTSGGKPLYRCTPLLGHGPIHQPSKTDVAGPSAFFNGVPCVKAWCRNETGDSEFPSTHLNPLQRDFPGVPGLQAWWTFFRVPPSGLADVHWGNLSATQQGQGGISATGGFPTCICGFCFEVSYLRPFSHRIRPSKLGEFLPRAAGEWG